MLWLHNDFIVKSYVYMVSQKHDKSKDQLQLNKIIAVIT